MNAVFKIFAEVTDTQSKLKQEGFQARVRGPVPHRSQSKPRGQYPLPPLLCDLFLPQILD